MQSSCLEGDTPEHGGPDCGRSLSRQPSRSHLLAAEDADIASADDNAKNIGHGSGSIGLCGLVEGQDGLPQDLHDQGHGHSLCARSKAAG